MKSSQCRPRHWTPVEGWIRRISHLADQGAKLCGAQVSIDPTENGDRDDDVTQDAAQIVKGVDTNCRRQSSGDWLTFTSSAGTQLSGWGAGSHVRSCFLQICIPLGYPQERQRLPMVNPFSKWMPDWSRQRAGRCANEELTGISQSHLPGPLCLLYSQSSLDISSLWV